MYESEIASAAAALSGAEAGEFTALAGAAEAELAARLRDGVTEESVKAEFIAGAAFLALSLCSAAAESGGASSWRAGNMSVTRRTGGAVQSASALRQEAEALMAPYLRDGGFAFSGVEG